MQEVETVIQKSGFLGTTLSSGNKTYTVKLADNYSYTDPVDGSQANKQVGFKLFKVSQIYFNYITIIIILFYKLGPTDII